MSDATKGTTPSVFPTYWESGMTLRAYFAAAALQGMAAGEYWNENFDAENVVHLAAVARVAWLAADAMLKERKEQK